MVKYCSECGKSVESSWNLCPNCGFNLKDGQPSVIAPSISKQTTSTNILFKAKGFYCEGKPHGFTLAGNLKRGYIVLSSEVLVFTPKRGKSISILIPDITKIESFSRRGYNMLGVQTTSGKFLTYWVANMIMGNYLGGKTSKLQALLTQALLNSNLSNKL